MYKHNLRVMVAAEKSRVRDLFKRVVRTESEGAISVVGEVGTSGEALTMARETKPDVVLLDLYLPGSVERDARITGLDVARTLAAELSGALVVLVTNADAAKTSRSADAAIRFMPQGNSEKAISLDELHRSRRVGVPLFADIKLQPQAVRNGLPSTSSSRPDFLFYAVGVTAVTFFFSPFAGIFLIVKGANRLSGAFHAGVHGLRAAGKVASHTENVPSLVHTWQA